MAGGAVLYRLPFGEWSAEMAWIELHQSLTTHKKTRRLARALGLGVPDGIPQTIGHLCLFWLWCVDGAEDGNLDDLDAQDIADAAGWTGDPDVFMEAMIAAGFIDKNEDGICVHGWDDYIGRLLAYRAKEKERNRQKSQRHRDRMKAAKEAETQGPTLESAIDPEWRKVVQSYEYNIGLIPVGEAGELLISYYKDLGADVVCKAIEVTNKAQAHIPWKYLQSVLQKWLENGINTPEKADAYTKDLERRLADAKRRKQSTDATEPPAISGDFY